MLGGEDRLNAHLALRRTLDYCLQQTVRRAQGSVPGHRGSRPSHGPSVAASACGGLVTPPALPGPRRSSVTPPALPAPPRTSVTPPPLPAPTAAPAASAAPARAPINVPSLVHLAAESIREMILSGR